MPPRPIGLLASTAVISPRPGKCALAVVVAVLVSLLCNRGAKQALKSMLLSLCFVSYVSMQPLIPCLSPSPYQISEIGGCCAAIFGPRSQCERREHQTPRGWSALLQARRFGHESVVQLLLDREHEAKSDQPTNGEMKAFIHSSENE